MWTHLSSLVLFCSKRWACRPARRQRTVIPQRQMCWKCWRKVIPLWKIFWNTERFQNWFPHTLRHCRCLSALKRDGFIHHLIRQLPPQDVCPARIPICRIFLSVQQKGGKFVRFSSRGRDMTALFLPIILKWNSVYWRICQEMKVLSGRSATKRISTGERQRRSWEFRLKRLPQNSGLTRRLSISALFTESVTSVLPISLASAAARRERI